MGIRVGIMGFGRIGRNLFRILYPRDDVRIVAIVDVAEPEALEYLLRFDTVHGRFDAPVSVVGGSMYVQGRQIRMLQHRTPGEVDWADLGVDVVIEATGRYRTREFLEQHVARGARRVVLASSPADGVDDLIVIGVNDDALHGRSTIVSAGSCTINAAAPLCKLLDETFGIEHAFFTAVHAYTNDQRLADVPHGDLRRSRAAAENIIPSNEESARDLARVIPALADRVEGMALHVPVPNGSCVDLVCLLRRAAQAEEVNQLVKSAAATRLRGIVEFTTDPIVSSDVVGNPHSGVFDARSTQVLGQNLLKTVTWYDNGWGYATRIVELVERLAALDEATAPAERREVPA